MEKCKNTNCNNSTKKNNVYCSLKCRNIYVNKNLRDYTKNSEALSCKKQYINNEKLCILCKTIIPYERRRNKYCSHSCAASETNLDRKHSEFTKNKMRAIAIQNLGPDFINKSIKCKGCDKKITLKESRKLYCSIECKKNFKRKNMNDLSFYKQDCLFKFNLILFPDEFDFKLIENFGWYKPTNRGNNLGGVSRDHMYSVRSGFENNVPPNIIAHPANCKLILQKENSSKHKKNSITLENLIERIEIWNKKYNIAS